MEVRLIFSDEPQMKKVVEELDGQETSDLLRMLFIQAKGGGEAAYICGSC